MRTHTIYDDKGFQLTILSTSDLIYEISRLRRICRGYPVAAEFCGIMMEEPQPSYMLAEPITEYLMHPIVLIHIADITVGLGQVDHLVAKTILGGRYGSKSIDNGTLELKPGRLPWITPRYTEHNNRKLQLFIAREFIERMTILEEHQVKDQIKYTGGKVFSTDHYIEIPEVGTMCVTFEALCLLYSVFGGANFSVSRQMHKVIPQI